MTIESLHTLPLPILRQRCAEQSTRFFQGQPSDTRYCFEMFRRAIEKQIEEAWEGIYEQYHALLNSWFQRHPFGVSLAEEQEALVLQSFERFWQALSPERFASFPNLPALLRYLQLCLHATLTDAMRQRQRQMLLVKEGELWLENQPERAYGNPEQILVQREDADRLWQWVVAHCKNRQEALLMRESLIFGLSPSQVLERHPALYSSVQNIYRIKENVMTRLRRSTDMPQDIHIPGD